MKKNKKINKKRLILFVAISFIIFIFYYLFRTGKIMYWKNPKLFFQPVIPINLAKYPVFEDCYTESGKYTFSYSDPDKATTLSEISTNFQILTNLKIKEGYELGRVRAVFYGVPSGKICNKWFYLAVRNKHNHKIIEGNDRINAFIIDSKEDLRNLGILFYGESTKPSYEGLYDSWNSEKPCLDNGPNRNCKIQYLPYPTSITNGQVDVEENGEMVLHRIFVSGILSNHSIVHIKLIRNPEGLVTLDSEKLISYEDGRLF